MKNESNILDMLYKLIRGLAPQLALLQQEQFWLARSNLN